MDEKVRQSNFELLRILCMFGVLTSHSLMAMYDLQAANFSFANEMRVFVMNASCLAVNCFVMISGYFQIRQSWRGFIGLWAPCLLWAAVCSSFALFNLECSVIEAGKNIFFPLTETELWFIKVYFALYLIAPLLNAGINHLNDAQLKLACLMLLVVDVYIGYIHQSSEVTVDGYHIIHFITLYTIAGMLRRLPLKTLSVGKLMGGVISCIVLMTLLHMCKMVFPPTAIIYSMRYNSPILFATSVLTFWLFTNLKIQNKAINWVSNSVLAVYLISSLPFFGPCYYRWLVQVNEAYTGVIALFLVVGIMILFYIACILVEHLRKWIMHSLEDKIISFLERRLIVKF